MASILRSGTFFRYLAGGARRLVYPETGGNFIRHNQALCTSTTFKQRFASTVQSSNQNLDQSIKKLDQDVRKIGRITRRDIEEVFEVIRLNRSASSSQSLLVIRCCGSLVPEEAPEIRTALVQKIWQTLVKFNVPMDVSHYNALLRVYLENEHRFSPTEFLAELESKGIEPNRVTYQRLISGYCQVGDIDGATKILEFMRAKQLPINEHIFNALIMGHSEADDIQSAVGILSVMKQSGLDPTADTYTVLLCAYAKHGKIDEILSTLEKCEANEIYLQDKDLFDIIYKLATNGHGDSVDKIIPRLRQSAGYNQDAVNLILRLVNKGREDTAYKILTTMPRGTRPDGELSDAGTFFIKQLVKSGRSAEKILEICRVLQEKGLNNRATMIAVEMATITGNMDIALPLFKDLQQQGLPIRQHYFWPLICAHGKISGDAVLDVLRTMQFEFNMTANGETVRDYVLPNLQQRNYEKIILTLRTAGISTSTAVTSCIHDALIKDRIKDAARLATSYRIYYQPGVIRRPLVDALKRTNDYQSYISILRSVYENLPRLQQIRNADGAADEQVDDENENQMQSEVVGQFVFDAVVQFQKNGAEVAQKILAGLVEQGLSMSKGQSERIQKRLGSSLTPEISNLLDKLTDGELEPSPYESRSLRLNFSDMSAEDLEKMVQLKEAKSENTNGLKRALLQAYLRTNNVEKVEKFLETLSKSNFVLTSSTYAQLIELYCNNNALEKALGILADIRSREPDFVLNDFKTMKVVHEFVANDQIDEAVAFLKTGKRAEKSTEERGFGYSALCNRVLLLLADKGRDADLTKVFDALEENNFIEINNVVLGPLVKVHLVNNDVKKALGTFEAISTKYNCTPWKNELSCKLIQLDDATNLQLLTDLSTSVHGEVNSLYDLVFSFAECGRIREARKILETPGLGSRPQRIASACDRYRRDGKGAVLEALVEATRDFHNVDRHDIFYHLLLTYCTEDSPEKALDLWTRMQEEDDVAPTDKFLTTLATFLKEKGVEVPFVVPVSESSESLEVKKSNRKTNAGMKNLKKSPKPDNLDDAIKTKKNVNTKANLLNESKMLETMVKENQFETATQHVMKMLDANTYLDPRKFRFYLNKMAEMGNYELFEQLSQRLTPDMKKILSFNNRLASAYLCAGKSVQFVDQTVNDFNNATTAEELEQLESVFPKGTMSEILHKHPELISKFEKFARNVAEKGVLAPINVLWVYHIEHGKLDQANDIMKNYLSESPKLMFTRLLREARDRKDETLPLNLLKALADTKTTEAGLGTVHSCLIDVYCSQQKYDEALKAVDSAVKDVCLENINRTALVRVQNGLEAAGKKFPHKIPDKKQLNAADSSSSSSSSSDDEPPKK